MKVKQIFNEIAEWFEIIALAGMVVYCLLHLFILK